MTTPNPLIGKPIPGESVDLIASGYEWICTCGRINHEIEITETVECHKCKKRYLVDEADHATG